MVEMDIDSAGNTANFCAKFREYIASKAHAAVRAAVYSVAQESQDFRYKNNSFNADGKVIENIVADFLNHLEKD